MPRTNNNHEHSHWHHRHWFFRLVFWAIIVVLIVTAFVTGVCIGFMKSGMAGKFGGDYGGRHMMLWRDWDGAEGAGSKYIFGEITAIDGSKITVRDNGAQEQVIFSSADTRIMESISEIPLSDLRVGQAISVWGANGLTGLNAKLIRVTRSVTPVVTE